MKIAIVGPAAPKEFSDTLGVPPELLPSGLGGTPVNELIRGLLELGHEVHLVTTSFGIEDIGRFDSKNLSISIIPLRSSIRLRALDMYRMERIAMKEELRRIEVDVIHAHWTYEFAWASECGKPSLVTAHDAPLTILRLMPNAYRLVRLLMAYRVLAKVKNLSAVSPYLSSQLRKQMLYRRPIKVIPNIVPRLPSTSTTRSKNFVVMDIATGAALKNVTSLIRAFAVVRGTLPDAELHLIGPGLSTGGKIARWAIREELSIGVIFFGTRDRTEIASHLAEASVFCHPSLEEAQPMSVLEAMASRLPIIGGSESGGMGWTLGHGTAGVMVDVQNPAAIAAAILELHFNKARRASCISNGVDLIENRFSSKAVAQAYILEYQRAIAEDSKTILMRHK